MTVSRIGFAVIAARFERLLVGAAEKTNFRIISERFDDANVAGRRDRYHHGKIRRVRYVDMLNVEVENFDQAEMRSVGNLRLLVLGNTHIFHIAKLPRGGIETIESQLRIPVGIQPAIRGISMNSENPRAVQTQLAFDDFEVEPIVEIVDPPISDFCPGAVLYQPVTGLIQTVYLIEHTETGVGTVLSLQVPLRAPATDSLEVSAFPSPRRRYNRSDEDSETPAKDSS